MVRVRKERQGRIDGILRPAVRGRGERRPDRRALRRRTDVIQDGLTDGVVLRIPGIVDGVEGTRVPVECAAQDAAPPVVVGDFELGVEPLEGAHRRGPDGLCSAVVNVLLSPGQVDPRPVHDVAERRFLEILNRVAARHHGLARFISLLGGCAALYIKRRLRRLLRGDGMVFTASCTITGLFAHRKRDYLSPCSTRSYRTNRCPRA